MRHPHPAGLAILATGAMACGQASPMPRAAPATIAPLPATLADGVYHVVDGASDEHVAIACGQLRMRYCPLDCHEYAPQRLLPHGGGIHVIHGGDASPQWFTRAVDHVLLHPQPDGTVVVHLLTGEGEARELVRLRPGARCLDRWGAPHACRPFEEPSRRCADVPDRSATWDAPRLRRADLGGPARAAGAAERRFRA